MDEQGLSSKRLSQTASAGQAAFKAVALQGESALQATRLKRVKHSNVSPSNRYAKYLFLEILLINVHNIETPVSSPSQTPLFCIEFTCFLSSLSETELENELRYGHYKVINIFI